jgi:flagellar export protein FliJ
MKFAFRLQSVFDLRRHLEDEQKDAYEKELQRLKMLTDEKRALEQSFAVWSDRYRHRAGQGMSPAEVCTIGRYIEDINRNIATAGRQIERQNANVEKERLLLVERMKDRKTMETLYDKQLERFRYEQGRIEEKQIEELIASRR